MAMLICGQSPSSRWWFASTTSPLVAGTFGPMANAFSICALAGTWRVSIPPGGTEEHGDEITDPKWLIAVNAISLAFALVANMSLLLNMARRIPFSVAQPITIFGWYISSFLLIALVALASSILQLPPADYAFTQAYYYGIMAALIYFTISSLMVGTVFGAYKGHYPREFKLTISQRTLMLQTISFLAYLLSGAAVFARVEGWKFLDAVYWADFTLLTVGVGDYAPATHTGRALFFPYAIGGILIIGLVIGSIRSLVLERGKKRMTVRMLEKERVKALTRLNSRDREVLIPIQSEGSSNDRDSANFEWKRRKEEFKLMRQVQDQAIRSRRWRSLLISAVAWFVLLFLGALVFMKSEHSQSWSYFQSLYFAYTSLLTIGYGDLFPMSNSGKPFFVFWSLLAVPTMTILIGNMGDTIVKGVRELTLWIGEWTILPSETPIKEVVKKGTSRLAWGKKWASESDPEIAPEIIGELRRRGNRGDRHNTNSNSTGSRPDVSNSPPDTTALVREIRRVISHLTNPHHKYSFNEWAYFLHLTGEEVNSVLSHHAPSPKAKNKQRRTRSSEGAEEGKWSWLGKGSPLIGRKSEPEWVLEKLVERLEGWLEEMGGKEERV
ncbi:MAG: Potassium channel [Trichoglossum hirsutum]|nr:MAG: Potassium channel [Trichoglossum hirsutum]